MSSLHSRCRSAAVAVLVGAASVLANPPTRRQPDPISIDAASPSHAFGSATSDLYGDNPSLPGGWDVGGPGPTLHVFGSSYGVQFFDETDGISNGERDVRAQPILYFSVDDLSLGQPERLSATSRSATSTPATGT